MMRGRRTVAPEVGAVIARPRLDDRLAAADLTALIAPAGYGKTTLLADWASDNAGAVAWLTLTEADRDPVRFLTDVTDALRGPLELAASAGDLGSPEAPAADADLDGYVAALHDDLLRHGSTLTVVLDDAHVLIGAIRTVQLLDALMQQMPTNVRLLVAARQLPAVRLQRLQLQRRVTVIDAAALAFTEEETALALESMQAPAGTSSSEEAYQATQGWPVAVRLWALASRNGHDTAIGDDAGAVSLPEYLTTEVLDAIDPELRTFVLEASIDDSVCAELVDQVRATADSATMLHRCYREGLFLTMQEGRESTAAWFNWHPVFASHVRQTAEREDTVANRERHRRAAMWWGGLEATTAVRHALLAQRPDLGAELAADAWPDLVLAGQTATVLELVRQLPADLPYEAELRLAVAFAEAARGDITRARHELSVAYSTANRLSDEPRVRFEARAAALSLLYLVTDPASLLATVERGRALLSRIEALPLAADPTTLALTRLCVGMGEARLQADPEGALGHLRLAAATALERGLTATHLVALAETCIPTIATGRLDEAERTANHVLQTAAAKGWGVPSGLAPALGYLGWYSYWRGDLTAAVDRLTTAARLIHVTDWTLAGLAAYFRALARLHQGEAAYARADLATMTELAARGVMPPYWTSVIAGLDAELLLVEGRREDARAWAMSPQRPDEYRLAVMSRARILLRVGEPERAIAAIDLLPADETFFHVGVLANRLRAEALFRLQRIDEAHSALESALNAAQTLDVVLPFLTDADALRPLLEAHRSDSSAAILDRILARIDEDAVQPKGPGELTPRESATLRGLATGMTLSEIAASQFVSVNTVKSHSARLYRKLDARNRRDAVRVAIARGLL